MNRSREFRFAATERGDQVTGRWTVPPVPAAAFSFAHGAGAGLRHAFMEEMAQCLADAGVATLRFQFPYMEGRDQGSRRPPDRAPVLVETVRAASALVAERFPELPRIAGGKSMGGRMTTTAASESPLDVQGIALLGFPLHPPGRPSTARAAHLGRVPHPMLFLQGTRDRLADLELLSRVLDPLGPKAELRVINGADHGFHMLKRSGRTDAEVQSELARGIASWVAGLSSSG